MTRLTEVAEIASNMVRRLRIREVPCVAAEAIRREIRELIVRMALRTNHCSVRPCEGKRCGIVVEAPRPGQSVNPVTPDAIDRKSILNVIRVFRTFKIGLMTCDASQRCSCVLMRRGAIVACVAIHERVLSEKRKSCLLVFLFHVHNDP
jgi:hypothetical protein